MLLEQIGKELKIIRIKNGWTLAMAQEITGVHKNTLSIYENNPGVMKLGKLFDILNKYNVDVDIFFEHICKYIYNKEVD